MGKKRIVLTGGGTAGHVIPNLAIIPLLREQNWDIFYIGTPKGIERELIEPLGIPYYPISTGKLRRYFDLKNFTDPFRVLKGVLESYKILGRIKPDVIFSKGGFVSLPVTYAAKLKGIPVILHESDFTPGLANRLALPFARKVCISFPETEKHLPKGKGIYTGNPIRKEILTGIKSKGLNYCGFNDNKKVLMIVGGSSGSLTINQIIRKNLDQLLKEFQIIHICGKGNIDKSLEYYPGYKQFEYVNNELADLYAAADYVICRSGANTVFEILALKKPSILIPLPKGVSRGDQILNARSFEKQGLALVLYEEDLDSESLARKIEELKVKGEELIKNMKLNFIKDSRDEIVKVINSILG